MLAIQEGAKQIYSDPQALYFFTGPEYGLKVEYLNILANHYGGEIEEQESLFNLLSSFKVKSLIPRKPKVYVVRYDKEFISHVDQNILDLNISGTIVGIYQDDKDESKLDKIYPNQVLRLNKLTPELSFKHLSKKFEKLPEPVIKSCIDISSDFYSASSICFCLNFLDKSILHNISRSVLEDLFGYQMTSDSERFKLAIASRNYKLATVEIDNCDYQNLNLLFYDILNTLLEIIKVLENSYTDSFVKPYMKLWDLKNATYLFNVTYDQLTMLRKISNYSPYISLMYIVSLLNFRLG